MAKAAAAEKKSFLNFENSPVPQEAIDAALKKRNQEAEEKRALLIAEDVTACQNVVNAGVKHLKALRKAAEEFHAHFKKLEGAKSALEFVEILNTLPIRHQIGSVSLRGDYDRD
jgi:hypothetical protein